MTERYGDAGNGRDDRDDDGDDEAPTARVAVVTGGSQGLGEALVRALVEDGWQVVTDARRADRLAAAVARLGPAAARVHPLPGDVTDPEHRALLVATAAALGPVSLVVNNASTLGTSPLPAV